MAIILNATPSNGLGVSSDNSGVIQFQSNTINTLSISTSGLMTAAYNGANPGLIPGQQMFILNTPLVGQNATGNQNIFGVGVTLSSNTVYKFELFWLPYKTAGTTSHTVSTLFGGTATLNWIACDVLWNGGTSYNVPDSGGYYTGVTQTSAVVITNARSGAGEYQDYRISGTLSVNTGGTFIPQYSLSAAPGGAYTVSPGSYALFYPVGSANSNVSIGTWA